MNGYIEGTYTLKSPLSHIGESQGPDSYLATQNILDVQGKPIEVFTMSGNAIRGMFRDSGGSYLLKNLGAKVPLEMFYLLFSGGNLSDTMKIDIERVRAVRKAVPHISIFGGGLGTQILGGKINCGDAYPICKECGHFIPKEYQSESLISWRQMTAERSYTRTDDAKDEIKRDRYLLEEGEAIKIIAGDKQKKKTKVGANGEELTEEKKKAAPQQMRYTVECMAAGTILYHKMHIKNMDDIEFGALTAAIYEWMQHPFIGGKQNVGMGECLVDYKWIPWEGTREPFISNIERVELGETAARTKDIYDEYLEKYRLYLADNKEKVVELLGK